MKRVYVSLMALVASLAIGVFSTPSVFGQATFGNISGTVTDPAGAAIPNAQVTITDTERGEVLQTKTNSSGNYSQTHLLAGQYKVAIAAPGFADLNAAAVVQVDATTRVDGQLQIGKAATEVTVSGEAPLLIKDRYTRFIRSSHRKYVHGSTGPSSDAPNFRYRSSSRRAAPGSPNDLYADASR